MKIVFPEYQNEVIKEAIRWSADEDFEAVEASDLNSALSILRDGGADAMIAGIDYTTRDVILACRDILGVVGETFSSCMYFSRPEALGGSVASLDGELLGGDLELPLGGKPFILADAGVTKEADAKRMTDIVLQTYETALKLLDEEPRIAMLSFSTKGSARDASIDKINEVIKRVREVNPAVKIDGEMQLDAAINPRVAARKLPGSEVAGRANILIVPDLNSGNILYKAIEQFGGYTAAGPILQGFKKPVSDLSRGSTVEDVELVVRCMERIYTNSN